VVFAPTGAAVAAATTATSRRARVRRTNECLRCRPASGTSAARPTT